MGSPMKCSTHFKVLASTASAQWAGSGWARCRWVLPPPLAPRADQFHGKDLGEAVGRQELEAGVELALSGQPSLRVPDLSIFPERDFAPLVGLVGPVLAGEPHRGPHARKDGDLVPREVGGHIRRTGRCCPEGGGEAALARQDFYLGLLCRLSLAISSSKVRRPNTMAAGWPAM